MSKCPYCGDTIVSDRSNFCASCGRQIREIPPEDVPFVAPEEERYNPMQVAVVRSKHSASFIHMFGIVGRFQGRGYLRRMTKYIDLDIDNGNPRDYRTYLEKVAADCNVSPESIKRAVGRWLTSCWADDFLRSKVCTVLEIDENGQLPRPLKQVELLCKAYEMYRLEEERLQKEKTL